LSSSQVVTGEAVALDLRAAGLPSRVLAGLLDAALVLVVLLTFGVLAEAVSLNLSAAAGDALAVLVLVVVLIAYPVTFETVLRGRTPGKAAMGLRVVRDDGGPIGFRHALVRGLTGAFLERPGISLFLVAVVTSLLHPRDKRLGDVLAGTVVLRERVSVRGGRVAQMPPALAGWAAGLDLSGLRDDLALSIRQFLARADELTPAARDDLGGRLVRAVIEVTTPPPPPGAPGPAVLAAVLAERRRREEQRLARPSYQAPAPDAAQRPGARPGDRRDPGAPDRGVRGEPAAPSPAEPAPQPGPGGFAPPS
jgi:uncharacterized RDD family membrane protein YckC